MYASLVEFFSVYQRKPTGEIEYNKYFIIMDENEGKRFQSIRLIRLNIKDNESLTEKKKIYIPWLFCHKIAIGR